MKVSDFLEKSSVFSIGISSSTILSGVGKIVFDEGIQFAYDGNIYFQSENLLGIEGSVEKKSFFDFLSKIKDKEIESETTENLLKIKSGRSVASFVVSEKEERPVDFSKCEWKTFSKEVASCVELASKVCGNDYTNISSTMVHLCGNVIEATDEERIIRFRIEEKFDEEILIPKDLSSVLDKFSPVNYCIFEGWIAFQDKNSQVLAQRCSSTSGYFDLDSILEKCKGGTKISFPENFSECVEKASTFLSDMKFELDKRISIKCKAGRMKIESKGSSGSYSEIVPFDSSASFSFSIVPSFLLEILEKKDSSVFLGEEFLKIKGKNYQFVASLSSEQ